MIKLDQFFENWNLIAKNKSWENNLRFSNKSGMKNLFKYKLNYLNGPHFGGSV